MHIIEEGIQARQEKVGHSLSQVEPVVLQAI
jgi:hypothetical protein